MLTITEICYKMGQVEPEPEEPGDVEPEPAPEPGQSKDDEKQSAFTNLELDQWDNSTCTCTFPTKKTLASYVGYDALPYVSLG